MNEVDKAGHVMFNADAWVFNDPVVFWSIFTVLFSLGMVIFAIRVAVKKAEEERREKEGKGGGNS
ncbi:MAG: hypothetical protein Q9M44_05380 [Ghiorsea sp.]|nr:hypothetical protein [Ghiorsea sp.]